MKKQQIIDYISSVKAPDMGFCLQEQYQQRTLMSSAFAILTLELIGELENWDSQRELEYFRSAQDPDSGLFIDPLWKQPISNVTDLEMNYLHYQSTAFTLSVLSALGSLPQYEFKFLDPFKDDDYLVRWLQSLDWSNPWHESNKVMFLLQFFAFLDIVQGERGNRQRVLLILEELRPYQDPKTGLWGTHRGASKFIAMAGTFHFLSFYQHYGVPISHPEAMHGSTMALQARDGLFHPFGGGGACEDLDALYILGATESQAAPSGHYRDKMEKAYHAILNAQNDDGGFCWSKRPKWDLNLSASYLNPFSPRFELPIAKWILKRRFLSILIPNLRDPSTYRYSNWDQMKYDVAKSDTWSTWFRLLSLAAIERSFPEFRTHDIEFKHRTLPALGWQPR